MKNALWFASCLLCLALTGLTACTSTEKDADKEGPEIKVQADQLPPAVRATLAREAPGVTIKEADMQTDAGKTIYEADATLNGVPYEIKVAADGTLVSKSVDTEEQPATKPAK